MKYDHDKGRFLDDWEADLEEDRPPRRPAPGKRTLTDSIPVQRRARPDARPAQKVQDVAQFAFVHAYDHAHDDQVKEPRGPAFPDEVPLAFLASPAEQACRDAFNFDYTKPVQRAAAQPADDNADSVHAAAAKGIEAPSQQLPHLEQIQKSFGHHDVSHVQAHIGGAAAEASAAMGAEAYATGNDVAFAGTPDLHTAAHEAAHVVQQKGGVQLKGGVGEAGDAYERHADAVADKVVAGESAESLLDQLAGSSSSTASSASVQHKKGSKGARNAAKSSSPSEVVDVFSFALESLERAIQTRDYDAANAAMAQSLEVLPKVEIAVRPGPWPSVEDQSAVDELRRLRIRFEELAPRAPSGGTSSDEERRSWLARTPVTLAPKPAQSTPRPGDSAPPSPPSEHAPITGVPIYSEDADDRAHNAYLSAHWDQIREAARQHFAANPPRLPPRLAWAVDDARRARQTVDAIFPALHVSGQLEALVAPLKLDTALQLGLAVEARPGEDGGDRTWNPNVGTTIALYLEERLTESIHRMGTRYVTAYDARGGEVTATDLARSDAMDGVASQLLTPALVRVWGPIPKPTRPLGAKAPRKWRWLGARDPGMWNWIEVTDPHDATAEDVAQLLPADVAPIIESDGRYFRMPEEWARTQAGAGEHAPSSATRSTGTELAASPFALDAAIEQAGAAPKVSSKSVDLEAITATIAGHISQLVSLLGTEYADRVVPAYTVLGAAKVANDRQRRDLARVFVAQEKLLAQVLQEIEIFHSVSYSRGRTRGGAAMEGVYLEFALAAGNSHLYHVGRRHLDAARAKAASVGKRLAEEALVASGSGANKLGQVGGAGADDAKERQRDRFDQLATGAADSESIDVEASIDSFLLHTQTLEVQLDAMATALSATDERIAGPMGMGLAREAEELRLAVAAVREQTGEVRTWLTEKLAGTPNASARQQLLERAQAALGKRISSTQIIEIAHRVVAMLERVEDAERRIQIFNTAIIALGISVVSAGAGMAVQAALTTPRVAVAVQTGVMTAGRVGAAAGGLLTEATVGAWLQTKLLGGKLDQAMGENLLGALLTLGTVSAFQKVTARFGPFTAENLALWERLGGKSAAMTLRATHVTIEMALGAGAGYAALHIVRSPVEPTEDEALQWAMQGASIVAGRWIMGRLSASMARLQRMRARVPADVGRQIDATLKEIDGLNKRAEGIIEKPGDQPEILELFAEHQRIVGAEETLVGDSADGVDGAPQPRTKDGDKTPSGREREAGYVETVLTLAGLHQIRPGHWQGDEAVVRRLVEKKRALPLVEEVGANGDPQWSVTTGGKRHTIEVGDETRTSAKRKPFSEEARRENQVALAKGEPGYNAVVGYVNGHKKGVAIMQRLMRGDKSALAEIGFESNGNFDPSTREWGLGKFSNEKYVIVAGEHGAVDWSAVAGVKPVGHSHPLDAFRIKAHEGKRLDFQELASNPSDDTEYVMSSPADIQLIAKAGVDHHSLALPYEHVGGTEITLASATPSGREHVVLLLKNARQIRPGPDGATRYRVRAIAMAGDTPVWHTEIDAVFPANGKPRLEFNSSIPDIVIKSGSAAGAKTKSGARPTDELDEPSDLADRNADDEAGRTTREDSIVEDVTPTEEAARQPPFGTSPKAHPNGGAFQSSVEFTSTTGRTYRVYQREIDWDFIRTAGDKRFIGKTNAEAARAGIPPQLPDGYFATLHHSQQSAKGPWFEASTEQHNIRNAQKPPLHPHRGGQHPYHPLGRGKGSLREQFQAIESPEYWKWREANR